MFFNFPCFYSPTAANHQQTAHGSTIARTAGTRKKTCFYWKI